MININKNHHERLHKKCKPLYDYCSFVDRTKTNLKKNMDREAAIDEALDWAIEQNLLEGLIKEQRAQVKMDILTNFDQEQYDRNRRREGAQEKLIEVAKSFYANGVSIEIIANSLHMTEDQVREIVKEPVPAKTN